VRRCGCYSHDGFLLKKEVPSQRELWASVVDSEPSFADLDSRVSVSASEVLKLHWDDDVIDSQYRRFLNGS